MPLRMAQADIRTCTGCTLVSSRSLQLKGMAKLILKFCLALCVCGAVLYGIPATIPVPGLFRVGSGASFGPFVTSSEVTGLLGAPTNFTKNEPKSILDNSIPSGTTLAERISHVTAEKHHKSMRLHRLGTGTIPESKVHDSFLPGKKRVLTYHDEFEETILEADGRRRLLPAKSPQGFRPAQLSDIFSSGHTILDLLVNRDQWSCLLWQVLE